MKRYFFTGLALFLPVVLTYMVMGFLINLLTAPFVNFTTEFLSYYGLQNTLLLSIISKTLILISLALITIVAGFFGRLFIFRPLINLGDKILHNTPIISTIYRAAQDVIQTLFDTDKGNFSQVVLVSFPYKGIYSLGMLTSEALTEEDHETISVFVPATPNPTMGFMLLLKRKDLIFLDMKVDDALKAIISCGVVFDELVEQHKK